MHVRVFDVNLNTQGILIGGLGQYSNIAHAKSSTDIVLTFLPSQFFHVILALIFSFALTHLQMVPFPLPLKTMMEVAQIDTNIGKGPNNGIAGTVMRIISREYMETQDMHSDDDNDDTQSNDRGVTNGYAFGPDTNHLARTPN